MDGWIEASNLDAQKSLKLYYLHGPAKQMFHTIKHNTIFHIESAVTLEIPLFVLDATAQASAATSSTLHFSLFVVVDLM